VKEAVRLVDRDAALAVDDDRIRPGKPVGRHFQRDLVIADQPDLRPSGEPGLEQQREDVGGRFLVQGVAEIAIAALGRRFGRPKRLVQLGGERIGGVGRSPKPEARQVLQFAAGRASRRRQTAPKPRRRRPGRYPRHAPSKASLRAAAETPSFVLPSRDLKVLARPNAGCAGCHEIAAPSAGEAGAATR
jgi:hypothetical protein